MYSLKLQKIDAIYARAEVSCEITSMNKDALSSYKRAKTSECGEAVLRVACLLQNKKLFPSKLPRFCPLRGKKSLLMVHK